MMDRKWKVTSNIFLPSNFCGKSITLITRMSIFCCVVTIESKEPSVKNMWDGS